MSLIEKCVKENSVFQGRILHVRNDDVLDGAGNPCTREHIVHPGGACALYVQEGKVALVRQYRYVYGEDVTEADAEAVCESIRAKLGEDVDVSALPGGPPVY